MNTLIINGVNIQFPWSNYIIDGKKTIETRFYRIPEKHIGKPVALIETPGPNGKFKARITAIIIFESSFEYKSKKLFEADKKQHLVDEKSENFSWRKDKNKWGWKIKAVIKLKTPIPPPRKRGIVFCSNCEIPLKLLEDSSSLMAYL